MILKVNRRVLLTGILSASICFLFLWAQLHSVKNTSYVSTFFTSPPARTSLSDASAEVDALNAKALHLADGKRIVARVFYGRRALVEILEVYLRRNLKVNGGVIDQVEFAWQNGSTRAEDIQSLDRLIAIEPSYVAIKTAIAGTAGYTARYDGIKDDAIYLKIDDDMLYIDDKTCPSMVLALLEHPEYAVVSANVVRHPVMTQIHARKGALYPFVFVQDEGAQNTADWQPSKLPAGSLTTEEEDFEKTKIPVQRYSYLPLRSQKKLDKTPLSRVEYGHPGLCSWASPYCCVQAHMSFFTSKEEGTLDKYDFGVWDMHYMFDERYSVNFIAWRGRYIFEGLENGIIPADDEHWLSVTQVKLTGNHHYAIGAALTSHLSYSKPEPFAEPNYDIIVQKYKSLARETGSLREWAKDVW